MQKFWRKKIDVQTQKVWCKKLEFRSKSVKYSFQ